MTTISTLIGAYQRPDQAGLQALAVALAAAVKTPPSPPTDPVALYDSVEDAPDGVGSWDEVRAAADYGDLTLAEYEYLAAAVDALTMEDTP